MPKRNRQRLIVKVYDHRNAEGDDPEPTVKTFSNHREFLRYVGRLAKADAQISEQTVSVFHLYDSEQPALFDETPSQ